MAGERKDREGEGRKLSPSRISNSHQHGSFEIYSINSDDGKSDDGTRVAALFRSALRYVPLSSDDFRYSRRTSSASALVIAISRRDYESFASPARG